MEMEWLLIGGLAGGVIGSVVGAVGLFLILTYLEKRKEERRLRKGSEMLAESLGPRV